MYLTAFQFKFQSKTQNWKQKTATLLQTTFIRTNSKHTNGASERYQCTGAMAVELPKYVRAG